MLKRGGKAPLFLIVFGLIQASVDCASMLDVARMCLLEEGRGIGLINRAALEDYSITAVHEVSSATARDKHLFFYSKLIL